MKKTLIAVGLLILILIFLNPTNSDFQYFTKGNGFIKPEGGRIKYYVLFSTYQVKFSYFDGEWHNNSKRYIGFAKNFIAY